MGNSNSHPTQVLTPQWAHSYPRPKQIRIAESHVKVLPQHVPPLRLRSTDNGTILHNGGTISGRKQGGEVEEVRVYRQRSSSAHRPPRLEGLDKSRFGSEPDLRYRPTQKESRDETATKQRISRSRKKYKAPPAPPNGSGMESSSPDLNHWDTHPGDCTTPGRRARLFKTRAETNKRNITNVKRSESEETKPATSYNERTKSNSRFDLRQEKYQDEQQHINNKRNLPLRRTVSHEVISRKLSTPEFQAELLEKAQKLRPRSAVQRQSSRERKSPIGESSTTSPITQNRIRTIKPNNNIKREQSKERNFKFSEELRVKLQNKENDRITKEKNEIQNKKLDRDVPAKSFYFGMEQNNNTINNNVNEDDRNNLIMRNNEHRMIAIEKNKNLINLRDDNEAAVDKFAASFHKVPAANVPNTNTNSCSSSFASEPDDEVDGGIMLQLRPTLPKKQLEIPRFSPTAAWRLLSMMESIHTSAPSPGSSDDIPLVLEERIHAPLSTTGQPVVRSNHDKSGDSGISGDASPGGCHESSSEIAITSSKNIQSPNSKSLLMAWTPQQDLEEESSSDGIESPMNSPKDNVNNIPGAKFSPRGQIFSTKDQPFLSLPRDEHLSVYIEQDAKLRNDMMDSRFNSLKKFTGALVSNPHTNKVEACLPPDSNWVLSKSVPSSLNNSHIMTRLSLSNPSSPEHDEEVSPYYNQSKTSSHSYLATGGRMMYLPEYQCRLSPESSSQRNVWSKSCENISTNNEPRQTTRALSPVTHYSNENSNHRIVNGDFSTNKKKGKRFTFQSTVRIIENRKLAERLSREAELKENQRLTELEAMRRVEEEFQRKRAREKANIRHQLRLFNLDENNFTSLPPLDWGDSRAEPDGAPSSSPTCQQSKLTNGRKVSDGNKVTPTTQILSEFRETTRDYRDYRHSRYGEHQDQVTEIKRSVVEHPRVVYDMPKNTPVYVSAHQQTNGSNQADNERRSVGVSTPRSSSSDNYRRDFAHGAVPIGGRSLASSDSELSQPHTRPTSREHRSHLLHRSRSASPSRSSSSRSSRCSSSSNSSPPRSLSASPTRIVVRRDSTDLSRTPSPHRVTINGHDVTCDGRDVGKPDDVTLPTLPSDSTTTQDLSINNTSTLPRLTLASVQPFSKREKSFKPIIFNPRQSNNNNKD